MKQLALLFALLFTATAVAQEPKDLYIPPEPVPVGPGTQHYVLWRVSLSGTSTNDDGNTVFQAVRQGLDKLHVGPDTPGEREQMILKIVQEETKPAVWEERTSDGQHRVEGKRLIFQANLFRHGSQQECVTYGGCGTRTGWMNVASTRVEQRVPDDFWYQKAALRIIGLLQNLRSPMGEVLDMSPLEKDLNIAIAKKKLEAKHRKDCEDFLWYRPGLNELPPEFVQQCPEQAKQWEENRSKLAAQLKKIENQDAAAKQQLAERQKQEDASFHESFCADLERECKLRTRPNWQQFCSLHQSRCKKD